MLSRDDFFRAVLPENGLVCITPIGNGVAKNLFFPSRKDLTDRFPAQQTGVDMFYAPFTFDDKTRKQEHAKSCKVLWLDVDFKGGPYATVQDVAVDLVRFCTDAALPPPAVIISTGGGVHVYWLFNKELVRKDWLERATALKKLCATHKFYADPAPTCDSARVLRVPGTFSYKRSAACEVVHYDATSAIDPTDFPVDTNVRVDAAITYEYDPVTAALANSKTSVFSDILDRTIEGDGCAQLAFAIANQDKVSEPIWRSVLSIAKFCTDGEDWIHGVSMYHPNYSKSETDQKAAKIIAPHRCETFEANNPSGCAGCKHKGSIVSPISLSRRAKEAKVETAPTVAKSELYELPQREDGVPDSQWENLPLPHGYGFTESGFLFRKGKSEDVIVFQGRANIVDFCRKPFPVGMVYVIQFQHVAQPVRKFEIEAVELQSVEGCRKVLAREGLVFLDEEFKELRRFLQRASQVIVATKEAPEHRVRFGWQDDQSFLYGPAHLFPDGSIKSVPTLSKDKVGKCFKPKGTIGGWLELAQLFGADGLESYRAAWLLGSSCVLYDIIGLDGLWISLYAGSGTGKSTIGQLIVSTYGNPDMRDGLPMYKEDTALSRINRLGKINSFPALIDEITNITPEQLSDISYQVTQGRGRHRMLSSLNEERLNETKWNTAIITTSNASVMERIRRIKSTPEGEMYRIIEIPLRGLTPANAKGDWLKASNRIRDMLLDNYGTVAEKVLPTMVVARDAIKKAFDAELDRLTKGTIHTPAERYWLRAIAGATTFGALLESEGVMPFSNDECRATLLSTLDHMRSIVGKILTLAPSLLVDFLNEHMGQTLTVKNPDANGLLMVSNDTRHLRAVSVRYNPDTREVWVAKSAYDSWLSDRNVIIEEHLRQLSRKGSFNGVVNKSLTEGIRDMPSAPTSCYQFVLEN